jgi:hypothetical protein
MANITLTGEACEWQAPEPQENSPKRSRIDMTTDLAYQKFFDACFTEYEKSQKENRSIALLDKAALLAEDIFVDTESEAALLKDSIDSGFLDSFADLDQPIDDDAIFTEAIEKNHPLAFSLFYPQLSDERKIVYFWKCLNSEKIDCLTECLKSFSLKLTDLDEFFFLDKLATLKRYDVILVLKEKKIISDQNANDILKKISDPDLAHELLKSFPLSDQDLKTHLITIAEQKYRDLFVNPLMDAISSPQTINIHNVLIDLADKFHYAYDNIAEGICVGITSAANLAILINQHEAFNKRIENLLSIFLNHLSTTSDKNQAIELTYNQIKQDVDILAFFDSVYLLFNSLNDLQIECLQAEKTRLIPQNETYKLAASIELEKKGDVNITPLSVGFYNVWEFENYLQQLTNFFNEHAQDIVDPENPWVVLNCNAPKHVVSISYNVLTKEYIFNDSNFLPLVKFNNLANLSQALFRAFDFVDPSHSFDPYTFVLLHTELLSFKEIDVSKLDVSRPERSDLRKIIDTQFAAKPTNFTLLGSALAYSASSGLEEVMQFGLNPHEIYVNSQTPLIFASFKGNLRAVELLIHAKADVNKCNVSGFTPLMFACCYGHEDCVRALIQAGADSTLKNSEGFDALDIAKHHRQDRIAKLLEDSLQDAGI